MKMTGKPGKTTIDGQKLKAAREAKGLSVTAMAAAVTMSRAQVIQIEEGGERAFYNARHKMLAIRKYADALGIPFEGVVATDEDAPIPEAPEESAQALTAPAKAGPRAGIARNAAPRRHLLMAIGLACVIISVYAIKRSAPLPAQQVQAVDTHEQEISSPSTHETLSRNLAVTVPAMTQDSENATQLASPPLVMAEPASGTHQTLQADCQPERAASALRTWSPDYQRKPGTRLYITSPLNSLICVSDASGKSQLLNLKPMAGQAFTGKPPYTVRSIDLAKLDIYLQGMRVKIPAETEVMRLIPNPDITP